MNGPTLPSRIRSKTVSVVIPTIGLSDHLESIVNVLLSHGGSRVQIIVCQSGSDRIYNLPSQVTYIRYQPLLLAAASRNYASGYATGDYLLFLDDDNIIDGSLVDTLAAVLDSFTSISLVGPMAYQSHSSTVIQCSGVYHRKYFGLTDWRHDDFTSSLAIRICDAVPNIYMVRRTEFEGIHGFDSDWFPMDFEESDLAYRLKSRFGGLAAITSSVTVRHDVPRTTASSMIPKSIERAYTMGRNRSLFYARHFSTISWLSWLFIAAPIMFALYAVNITRAHNITTRYKWKLVRSLARGYGSGSLMSFRYKWQLWLDNFKK